MIELGELPQLGFTEFQLRGVVIGSIEFVRLVVAAEFDFGQVFVPLASSNHFIWLVVVVQNELA